MFIIGQVRLSKGEKSFVGRQEELEPPERDENIFLEVSFSLTRVSLKSQDSLTPLLIYSQTT